MASLQDKPVGYILTIGYPTAGELFVNIRKALSYGYIVAKDEMGNEKIFKPASRNGNFTAQIVKIE